MNIDELKFESVKAHLTISKVPFSVSRNKVITTNVAVLAFNTDGVQLFRKGLVARRFQYERLNIDRLVGLVQ